MIHWLLRELKVWDSGAPSLEATADYYQTEYTLQLRAHLLLTSSSSFIVYDLLSYVTCCIQAPKICPYLFLIPLYVCLPVFWTAQLGRTDTELIDTFTVQLRYNENAPVMSDPSNRQPGIEFAALFVLSILSASQGVGGICWSSNCCAFCPCIWFNNRII